MRATQAGAGAILTDREKRPRLKKDLDENLPVNVDIKKPTNEVVGGRPLSRTASGKTKA